MVMEDIVEKTYCISSINTPGVLLFSHLKSKCSVLKKCHSAVLIEDALLFYINKQLQLVSYPLINCDLL